MESSLQMFIRSSRHDIHNNKVSDNDNHHVNDNDNNMQLKH